MLTGKPRRKRYRNDIETISNFGHRFDIHSEDIFNWGLMTENKLFPRQVKLFFSPRGHSYPRVVNLGHCGAGHGRGWRGHLRPHAQGHLQGRWQRERCVAPHRDLPRLNS